MRNSANRHDGATFSKEHCPPGQKPPSLSRIVDIANELFPFDCAEGWDSCGIQIGDPERRISGIAFSLDATPQTIAFAANRGCELLITHHPILIEPIRNIVPSTLTGKTILAAARQGVDILSLHTNLDAADGGLNDRLAQLIGLTAILVPAPARCARMGKLHHAMLPRELARRVASTLRIDHVRLVGDSERPVTTVFLASGSGMGYLDDALRLGADIMITGDVRYHAAREAEAAGLPVIDAGHYGLEKIAAALMKDAFQDKFEAIGFEVACVHCDLEEEPFVHIYNP